MLEIVTSESPNTWGTNALTCVDVAETALARYMAGYVLPTDYLRNRWNACALISTPESPRIVPNPIVVARPRPLVHTSPPAMAVAFTAGATAPAPIARITGIWFCSKIDLLIAAATA